MHLKSSHVAWWIILAGCGGAADLPTGGPFRSLEGSDSGTDTGLVFVDDSGVSTGTSGVIIIGPGTSSSAAGSTVTVGGSSGSGTGAGFTSSTSQATTSGVGTTSQGSSLSSSTGTGAGSSSSSSSSSAVPTWTELYNNYLSAQTSTIGDCDGSCHHHSRCSSASACYSWIGSGQQGTLSGGGSNALFTWDTGWMPTNGTQSAPQASADFAAWEAAGSPNN